jgi:hypothetical protein
VGIYEYTGAIRIEIYAIKVLRNWDFNAMKRYLEINNTGLCPINCMLSDIESIEKAMLALETKEQYRKQGIIEELKKVLEQGNGKCDELAISSIEEYIQKRLKELV